VLSASTDEQGLINRARHGDIGAFNGIVAAYQQSAYNVAYRLVGDTESAADVTQEAFVSAFRNIRSYRGGSFHAWLMRIVTNCSYDALRSRQRRPTMSLEQLTESESGPVDFADSAETPEDAAIRGELAAFIHTAIQKLPFDQRAALVLCDVQGMSYEEIAATTQTSIGTVKSRISRARAHVRTEILKKRELIPERYRHDHDLH